MRARRRSGFLQTRIDLDTGYGLLLPAFILMGIGMALVMSPMSTAAMNAVPPQKAGVGSGILSMSRMVGGTFGVAALGVAIALTLIGGRHAHRHDPATRPALAEAAGVPAARAPDPAAAEAVPVAR